MYVVNDLVRFLKDNKYDVINFGSNTIVINKFGFDSSIVEIMENKFDVELDFFFENIENGFDIVKIKIN